MGQQDRCSPYDREIESLNPGHGFHDGHHGFQRENHSVGVDILRASARHRRLGSRQWCQIEGGHRNWSACAM